MNYLNFRLPNSYFTEVYIKPHSHIAAYINGLYLGYMFETGKFGKLVSKNYHFLNIFKNACFFIMVTSAMILSIQLTVTDKQAKISALIFSVAPTLASIYFGLIIANDQLKIKQVSHIWYHIRNITRISYVFHPLIFSTIRFITPTMNLSSASLFYHFSFVMSINLIISLILSIYFEKPLLNFIFKKCKNSNLFE